MKSEHAYYDVFPKVFLVGKKTTVTVKPLSRHVNFDKEEYFVRIVPKDARTLDVYHPDYPTFAVKSMNGCIVFDYEFPFEQGYTLYISDQLVKENNHELWKNVRCESFNLFAVENDLFGLRPWKGNMHVHSFRSDGVESPEIVCAAYRNAGYDFMGLTDHALFEPSLEAIDAYKNVPLNMHIYSGEEVHSPDNLIHIINFGGDYSVNNLYRNDEPAYRAGVQKILAESDFPDGLHKYEMAASKWVFEQVHKANGLCILCHPNWTWWGAYNMSLDTYKYFMQSGGYDVLELINGGNEQHENQLQVNAWYNFGTSETRPVPVGNDDSHGSVNGKWFDIGFTYVLAPSLEREELFPCLKKGLCVACEHYHGDTARKMYGSERITRYMTFLDMEYFPLHDELCQEEGRMMAAYVNGFEPAAARLEASAGQIEWLQNHILGL